MLALESVQPIDAEQRVVKVPRDITSPRALEYPLGLDQHLILVGELAVSAASISSGSGIEPHNM